jgi:hypothetical protein
VNTAAETGKDAYAAYHAKQRSLGTGVNFISRFSLLFFGGELEVVNNVIRVDEWLKFKIGDKGVAGAVLLLALRDELHNTLLQHVASRREGEDQVTQKLIGVVRQLLADE